MVKLNTTRVVFFRSDINCRIFLKITNHYIKRNIILLRVFENRVLRRIFVPKRQEVVGGWSRLHKEELQNLYTSRNIMRAIKLRRLRWASRIARMGEMMNM
jgi:hypothetical protein